MRTASSLAAAAALALAATTASAGAPLLAYENLLPKIRGDPEWTPARVDAALGGRETIPVRVATPMPIRIVYQTAWVDTDGVMQFRDDIYHEGRPERASD